MQKIVLFLAELNNDDLNWIIQKGRKETLKADKILIYEGRAIDALYIVLSGSLIVTIESLNNRELSKIYSGEVVGEISFVDSRPPLATVKALEESIVLSIPRLQLTAKLQQDTGFAARFYHAISACLSDRMRGTVRRLGYGMGLEDLDNTPEELSKEILNHLQLAKMKFEWLKSELGVT